MVRECVSGDRVHSDMRDDTCVGLWVITTRGCGMGDVTLFTRIRHGQVQVREQGTHQWFSEPFVQMLYPERKVHYVRELQTA